MSTVTRFGHASFEAVYESADLTRVAYVLADDEGDYRVVLMEHGDRSSNAFTGGRVVFCSDEAQAHGEASRWTV